MTAEPVRYGSQRIVSDYEMTHARVEVIPSVRDRVLRELREAVERDGFTYDPEAVQGEWVFRAFVLVSS